MDIHWCYSSSSKIGYAFGLVYGSWSAVGKQPSRTSYCLTVYWYGLLVRHLQMLNHLGAYFGVLSGRYLLGSFFGSISSLYPLLGLVLFLLLFFINISRYENCMIFDFHLETCVMDYFKFYVSHVYEFSYAKRRCGWYLIIHFVCCKIYGSRSILAFLLSYFMANSGCLLSYSLIVNSMQYYTPYVEPIFCKECVYGLVIDWNASSHSLSGRMGLFRVS